MRYVKAQTLNRPKTINGFILTCLVGLAGFFFAASLRADTLVDVYDNLYQYRYTRQYHDNIYNRRHRHQLLIVPERTAV